MLVWHCCFSWSIVFGQVCSLSVLLSEINIWKRKGEASGTAQKQTKYGQRLGMIPLLKIRLVLNLSLPLLFSARSSWIVLTMTMLIPKLPDPETCKDFVALALKFPALLLLWRISCVYWESRMPVHFLYASAEHPAQGWMFFTMFLSALVAET